MYVNKHISTKHRHLIISLTEILCQTKNNMVGGQNFAAIFLLRTKTADLDQLKHNFVVGSVQCSAAPTSLL